jgi:hypothetical protein
MNPKKVSELTDQELMEEAKKIKSSPIVDALFIGFLIGIIVYSVAGSSWGFLTLIPLGMVYLLLKKQKRNEAVKEELKERNLQ